jgi:hypothetical protein
MTNKEALAAVVRYFLGLTDSEKLAYIVGLAMATDPAKLPTTVVARLLPLEPQGGDDDGQRGH